jgi:alpha/beta hydrolase fold
MRRTILLMATMALTPFLVLALVGCSSGSGDTGASQKKKAPEGTFDLPNGRSLYIECQGSGSPTVVFEVGQGDPRSDASHLQHTLAREYMTCTYDRANTGKSSKAPTPRTAGEIVTDLHQLLETASVPGPYVLAGTSAGGSFVQLYGRRFPDEVIGVVAMNPVPPADPWLDRVLPLFNKAEREAELAFYRGDNPEQIDWLTSSKEFKKAPAPPPVPFEMIISTEVQCEGESEEDPGPCLKSYDVYEEIEREIAQEEWPEGSYRQVDAGHAIYLEKPEVAINAVKRVSSNDDDD